MAWGTMPDEYTLPEPTPGSQEAGEHAWKGQCVSCGFLAEFGAPVDEINYLEMGNARRLSGRMFRYRPGMQGQEINPLAAPACFLHRASLLEEISDRLGGIPTNLDKKLFEQTAKDRINDPDRHCSDWFLYKPGLTPQKHFERREMLELEEQRRRFELELDKSSKEFQRSIFQESQTTQKEMVAISARQMKLSIVAIVAGVLVTFLATLWTTQCTEQEVRVVNFPTPDASSAPVVIPAIVTVIPTVAPSLTPESR